MSMMKLCKSYGGNRSNRAKRTRIVFKSIWTFQGCFLNVTSVGQDLMESDMFTQKKPATFVTSLSSDNKGGRGIRTPAGFDTPFGFQDRPLQPDLGIPPYAHE